MTLAGRLLWSHIFPSKVSTNSLEFSNAVAFGTTDGFVSALGKQDGKVLWQVQLNSTPLSIASSGGTIFAATKSSLNALSAQDGSRLWSVPLSSQPSSIGVSSIYVFVPSAGTISAYFGANGKLAWVAKTGDTWNSVPTISGQSLYVGSTDGSMYSLAEQSGAGKWSYATGGWVSSTPKIGESSVYFGSNDGYIYSLDSATGQLRWKYKTGEAVWSSPVLISSGSSTLLVAGSNDKYLYVLDAKTGNLRLSFAASDWVTRVLNTQSGLLVFSRDGRLTSLSLSPSCSIESPQGGSLVGDADLEVSGRAFSNDLQSISTSVRINDGQWIAASGKSSWKALVDVSRLPYGAVKIECSTKDSSTPSFSPNFVVTVVKSPQAALLPIQASAPQSVKPGSKFQVQALDSSGAQLSGIFAYFDGKNVSGSSPLELSAPASSGAYQLFVSKRGYQTAQINVVVQGDSLLIYLLVPALLAAAFLYFRGQKKGQQPQQPAAAQAQN